MTIGANGTLDVEKGTSGPGATLDGVKLTDKNASTVTPGITVGTGASAATLLLDDGTVISGGGTGTMTIGSLGTLDVEKGTSGPGATLDGVLVADDNTSTVTPGIKVGTGASAATLLLDDGATISGLGTGTMTIGAEGTLDVERNTGSAPDATLDGVKLTDKNASTVTPGITVGTGASAATLLVDDGTVISGLGTGTMTIGANGTLDVEKGTSGPGATLDGVKLTDKNASTVTPGITVGTGASAATLLLDDGTVISGGGTGTMTIGSLGTLDVEKGTSGPGATLDGVLVADDNTSTVTPGITVGTGASAATLLVDDGTVISGGGTGTMTIGAEGTLDVERNTGSAPDATLDGVKLTDKNTSTGTAAGITVGTGASAAVLLVDDGTVISGAGTGTMTIGANGTLDVEKGTSGPGATLDGVRVADDNTSTVTPGITVGTGASAATLLLDDGTTISGLGTGTMTIGAEGTLDVEKGTSGPGATLDGVRVADDNTSTVTPGITVGTGASAATLLLDDGTVIRGGGTGTMTIGAEGTLDVEKGTSGPGATLDGVKLTDKNTSTGTAAGITVGTGASAAVLLVDDGTVISGCRHRHDDDRRQGHAGCRGGHERPRRDTRWRAGCRRQHQYGNARHHGRHRSERGDAAA